MKDMMIDIEAERFNEWLEENYPDIVPESEAWEEAANLYLQWSSNIGHGFTVKMVSVL